MSARLHRAMRDHHTPQRLHALRGHASKCDRLDGRAPINWPLLVLVVVAVIAFGIAIDAHRAIAAVWQ